MMRGIAAHLLFALLFATCASAASAREVSVAAESRSSREVIDALADASLVGLIGESAPLTPELPPVPGRPESATLMMLCAMGGFGLFQVGYSARSWKLGALPDWYAEHAPNQIGRTLRYLPDQALETGYPWQFDAAIEDASQREPAAICKEIKPVTRFVVEVDAARGPPVR